MTQELPRPSRRSRLVSGDVSPVTAVKHPPNDELPRKFLTAKEGLMKTYAPSKSVKCPIRRGLHSTPRWSDLAGREAITRAEKKVQDNLRYLGRSFLLPIKLHQSSLEDYRSIVMPSKKASNHSHPPRQANPNAPSPPTRAWGHLRRRCRFFSPR